MGQNLVGYSTDPAVVKENCLRAPPTYQPACIGGAVGALGAKYKDPFPTISSFCQLFKWGNYGVCYEAAFKQMADWATNKQETRSFCIDITDMTLQKSCLSYL